MIYKGALFNLFDRFERLEERVYRHRVRPTVDAATAPMERLFGGGAGI